MDRKHRRSRKTAQIIGICAIFLTMLLAQPLPGTAEEPATSQTITVDPTGEARNGEGYSAVLYDNTNGLPTSEANAVAMTSDGCIWIGSYSGLIRYDGNSFERMDSTNGIASVVSLFVDSQDRLWIGTNDSGAAVLEHGKFRYYKPSDGLGSASVRSITEDSAGNVFLATTAGISFVDPEMELHSIDDSRISSEYIRSLRQGADHMLYGVTMGGAVFTIVDRRIVSYSDAETLGISGVRTICPDPKRPGMIYLGTEGSDLYYGKISGGFRAEQQISISPLEYINDVTCVDDSVWICTDTGIGFVQDGKCTAISHVSMTTSVESMCVDYQGNLWFTSSQQGIMKIVSNHFTDIFEKYYLQDEVVYSTCITQDMLLIGTKNSGLTAISDGNVIRHHLHGQRSARNVQGQQDPVDHPGQQGKSMVLDLRRARPRAV